MKHPSAWLLLFFALPWPSASPEETKQPPETLVMENDYLKVAVDRKTGGRVLSFIDKATGWDYAGGANCEDDGWGEYDANTFFLEGKLTNFKYAPYSATLEEGAGFKRITVSCSLDGLKIARTMTLGDKSREFEILQRHEVLGRPRRIFVRWHPWTKLDEVKGKESSVILPGPGDCIRKVNATYFQENWMRPELGCLIVANTRTGAGLWMTFQKENAPWVMTWCYDGYGIGAELLGRAHLAQPGEVLDNRITYFAFTPKDASKDLPAGVLKDPQEVQRARSFAERVRPNLAVIGPHSVWQGFKHLSYGGYPRPDTPRLYDWGLAECMFEAPGDQGGFIRARFAARAFPGKKMAVIGRLSLFDMDGKLVRRCDSGTEPQGGTPVELNGDDKEKFLFDRLLEYPLAGLPDGYYLVKAEIYGPDAQKPLCDDSRVERFTGDRAAKMTQQLEANGDPPFRPFIVAMSEKSGVLEKGVARVTVGVEEAGGIERKDWPVCAALALPQGAFKPGAPVRLLNPKNREVPAQVETAAVWPDGSLRWLHLFFGADVPANGFAFYSAEVGGKAGKGQKDMPLGTEDATSVSVDTGALKLRIAKKGGYGLGAVTVGKDEVLRPGEPGDLWWEEDQNRFYGFVSEEATLLRNGPLTCVVRIKGKYIDAKGEAKCLGELRIEASRGSAALRVLHTTVFLGDAYQDRLASFGMRLRTTPQRHTAVATLVDSKVVLNAPAMTLQQLDADRCKVDAQVRAGRLDGAFLLSGKGPAMGVYCREFWRHYPEKAEIDAAKGEIAFSHWPREAGLMEFAPPEKYYTACSSSPIGCATGMSKTHEVVLDWSGQEESAQKVYAAHDEPVVAIAAPRWNCATKVFGMLSAFDPKVLPEVEARIHRVWQCIERHRELFDMYGEWANGNHRNAWYSMDNSYRYAYHGRSVWLSNEDHHADAAWYLFARSGDRLFLKDAIGNTRAIRDVATTQYSPACPEFVGGSARHHYTIWLGMGDYGHSALDGFVMDWIFNGDARSWDMAKLQAAFFRRLYEGGGAWRYLSNPTSGLSRMYMETGDPIYREKADWIARTFADKKHRLWDGTGDTYFIYASDAIRWYAQISPEARDMWIQGVCGEDPKAWPKFSSLKDIGSVWELTHDPKLAERAWKQGMVIVNGEYKGFDARVRGINKEYACDLHLHTHMKNVLSLACAKEAMAAGVPPAGAQSQPTPAGPAPKGK